MDIQKNERKKENEKKKKWWYLPVIPVPRRLRQQDGELEASLGYIISLNCLQNINKSNLKTTLHILSHALL